MVPCGCSSEGLGPGPGWRETRSPGRRAAWTRRASRPAGGSAGRGPFDLDGDIAFGRAAVVVDDADLMHAGRSSAATPTGRPPRRASPMSARPSNQNTRRTSAATLASRADLSARRRASQRVGHVAQRRRDPRRIAAPSSRARGERRRRAAWHAGLAEQLPACRTARIRTPRSGCRPDRAGTTARPVCGSIATARCELADADGRLAGDVPRVHRVRTVTRWADRRFRRTPPPARRRAAA